MLGLWGSEMGESEILTLQSTKLRPQVSASWPLPHHGGDRIHMSRWGKRMRLLRVR